MMAVVSARRKEQEQEREKLQALTACHIAWHWGVAISQHYQTKRRHHDDKDMGERTSLLGIKPIVLSVLTTFRWGS
jgi:hypothetical protein